MEIECNENYDIYGALEQVDVNHGGKIFWHCCSNKIFEFSNG